MRRNIELKARCADLARAAAACESLGARRVWTRRQTDVYFAAEAGRLKLRIEEPGEAAVVRYLRDDQPGARQSLYEVEPACDPAAAAASLASRYRRGAVVKKTRTLYLLENVRIHLDDVAGLGAFVEFEAVMDGPGQDSAAHALLRRLRDALGVAEADLVEESYADMQQPGAS